MLDRERFACAPDGAAPGDDPKGEVGSSINGKRQGNLGEIFLFFEAKASQPSPLIWLVK